MIHAENNHPLAILHFPNNQGHKKKLNKIIPVCHKNLNILSDIYRPNLNQKSLIYLSPSSHEQ
jgi:hypothetical protein